LKEISFLEHAEVFDLDVSFLEQLNQNNFIVFTIGIKSGCFRTRNESKLDRHFGGHLFHRLDLHAD